MFRLLIHPHTAASAAATTRSQLLMHRQRCSAPSATTFCSPLSHVRPLRGGLLTGKGSQTLALIKVYKNN
ncbi:hypothetical protein E2C01_078251 [Portunus trituberculatus]|uniref:Uncharacterized protein n=1 Tax=Portunus trituberculatus TaxID=210409 RepID=A0A5B7INB8_PORTR|nr:hypothetical protein [Portunus trituberculatus]